MPGYLPSVAGGELLRLRLAVGSHNPFAEAEEASDSTESDSEDSDTDDSDDVEESDEEDQVLSIKQNLDHLKPSKEEEDILEREFQQMMQDSLGTAKLASKASSSMDLRTACHTASTTPRASRSASRASWRLSATPTQA